MARVLSFRVIAFTCLAVATTVIARGRQASNSPTDPDRWAIAISLGETGWYVGAHRIWCDDRSVCYAPVISWNRKQDRRFNFNYSTGCGQSKSAAVLRSADGKAVKIDESIDRALKTKVCIIACRSGKCR
jgi:hypothetical protein